jgi:hypothetical protein
MKTVVRLPQIRVEKRSSRCKTAGDLVKVVPLHATSLQSVISAMQLQILVDLELYPEYFLSSVSLSLKGPDFRRVLKCASKSFGCEIYSRSSVCLEGSTARK